ncbi:MAG: hypothetical protein ACJ8HQ_03675 [Chthoniobacterales bacterium]
MLLFAFGSVLFGQDAVRPEDVAASLAAGFSRHMTKPVDWRELKSAIEKLAEQMPA